MPTIQPAAALPPTIGTASKAAPSVLGLGEPGIPFADMLAGSLDDAPPVLQPTAAPGTSLPLVPVAVAVPPAVPLPTHGTLESATPALPLRTADTPTGPAAEGLENPFVLDDYPTPGSPADDDAKPTTPEPANDTDLPVAVPADPVVIPFVTPQPLPAAPLTEKHARPAPPPSISVVRAPAAPVPAPTPPVLGIPAPAAPSVQPPQTGRDFQYVAAPEASPAMVADPEPQSQPAATPGVPAPAVTTALAVPVILTGPALQVFSAAIAAASKHDAGERVGTDTLAAPVLTAIAAPLAAPPADSGQPLLDMRQERWPQAMIAHIEQLRDAADAVDTRIRLIPDALGTIDVAVSRDGDTLNVHFAAEQAATRIMLQDAQPRLAAIAEERGLRLGQTAVDANTAGSPQQQQRQPQRDAMAPAAPRCALTDEDTDRADTGRLA